MGTKRAHPVGSLDENPKDLQKVLMAVSRTREEEISCDGCFERLDRFVEAEISGSDAAGAMPPVEDHLEKCGDCREEFEALLGALRAAVSTAPASDQTVRGLRFLPTAKRTPTARLRGLA